MAGPHDWDWASPSRPSRPPGQPSTGPHIGYGGGQQTQTQVTAPPVQTGTPNFGPHGSGGGNQPPSTTIIDVAAEQDAIDDALAISLANQNNQTTPTPGLPTITTSTGSTVHPWDAVGDTSSPLINVSQVGGGPNNPGSLLYGINLADYGFNPKDEFLPKDFLDSLFEGSVVSGNEAVESTEPNIGTWSDVEAGNHPLFPGGLEDYYDPYGNLGNAWHEPSGGPGWEGYGDDYFGDRRDAKLDLLTALQSGAPSREMEQSGFFDTLVDPYAEAQSKALESGIFSGLMPGYTGEGMKRLLRSYGSGLQAPRYANVAKGGIVGLLGV